MKQSSNEPRQVIEAAEDGIFASFCERIKVSDIREYEEKQLSGAQGSNEQRLKFDTQVAKLGHQYVESIPCTCNFDLLELIADDG